MAVLYLSWVLLSNPTLGTFAPVLVDHRAGVIITQSVGSPFHVLPSTYPGKLFGIMNSDARTFSIRINGIEIFPGDSALFQYSGTSWDDARFALPPIAFTSLTDAPASYAGRNSYVVAVNPGATGLDFVNPLAIGSVNRTFRQINYNSTPDQGRNVFHVGSGLPANARVTKVGVEIVTLFNDATATRANIIRTGGFTSLMPSSELDITVAGSYEADLPGTEIRSGQIRMVFSASPDGNGGTQGQANVFIEWSVAT